MARDEEIAREVLDQNTLNQQALVEHGQALREVRQELRASKVERRQQEGRIVELPRLVLSLNTQIKGKGTQSDPTPEQSAAAAGGGDSGNRPPPPQQGAPREPDDDDDDHDEEGEGPRKGMLGIPNIYEALSLGPNNSTKLFGRCLFSNKSWALAPAM